MKLPPLGICILFFLPILLPAQAIDLGAARSEEQFRKGVQAWQRGYFNDALTFFEKSVSLQTANSLAQVWLGRTLLKSGFEQDAQRVWDLLLSTGRGDALLRDHAQLLAIRRSAAREEPGRAVYTVSAEIDANVKGNYPFKRPTSVRPRADSSFFVVAFGSNEVLKFDSNFKLITAYKGGLEGFDGPYDVLELDDGSLFVSEYGGDRIARCSATGAKVSFIGAKGRAEGSLLGPQYLATDGKGYLYVTDWGNSRVAKYDFDGNYILSITGLSGPTGIAIQGGSVYVSERTKKRVSIFDLSGNRLGAIGEDVLAAPEGISFTDEGSLLVADGTLIRECDLERDLWTVRGDTGAFAKRLSNQAMSPNGAVLAVDFDLNKVLLVTDASTLYSGLVVRVERVNSDKFPQVYLDLSVENRTGKPIVGLDGDNFVITEGRKPVGSAALVLSNTSVSSADVSLLIERSPAFESYRSDAQELIAQLYQLVTQNGRIKAISAAERPVREADFGEARLKFIDQAMKARPTADWRFDNGAKFAGDELITTTSGSKRAIIFLTTGQLGPRSFDSYSLIEIAAFLRNNHVAFYPVFFGSRGMDEDLAFLASETGGKSYSAFSAGGMAEVVKEVRARITPLYRVSYASPSLPEFGEKYIPLEVEAGIQKVLGRDESGYYSPSAP